jgi:uncharacterized tannase-like protein DUF6351
MTYAAWCRAAVVAVGAIVAACISTAAAADDGRDGDRKGLAFEVVSSPAHLVSGGDARVEVRVPDGVDYDDVELGLNGTDVSSASTQDPKAGISSRASSPDFGSAKTC